MWDCKYKTSRDHCLRRGTICYPGGKRCVLYGKFEYPLRDEPDELNVLKKRKVKKEKVSVDRA